MSKALNIAYNTRDAYSAERYHAAEWLNIADGLLKRGYSEDEVEHLMRSKYTRWAGDAAMVSENPEQPTAEDVLAYIEEDAVNVRIMLNEPR